MTTSSEVLNEIREIAARELCLAQTLELDHELVRDLGLDSLSAVVLAVGLEDRFSVRLDEAEARHLVTVKDLVELVLRKTGVAAC